MNSNFKETSTYYTKYSLKGFEFLFYVGIFELILIIFSHYFYDSFYFAILGNIFIRKYIIFISKYLQRKRSEQILRQFIDMITALSASLNIGYSIENSITEAKQTIKTMYGAQSIIYTELILMERKLLLNIPIESLFEDLGNRTGIEDIINFCEILNISKKTGGNLISIIRTTSEHFRENYNIKSEINTSVAARKFEQLIMFIMPIFIIMYIDFTQPGFFEPLYHNILGILISTVCLVIYTLSLLLTKKILTIEV